MSQPVPTRPVPTDATIYAVPALVRYLAVFSVTFCVVGIAGLLALPLIASVGDQGLWLVGGVVGFLYCLYLSVVILRGSLDTFAVADAGLWRLGPGRPPLFLAWEDIAAVEAQNVMQRLVVTDHDGAHRVFLEFHLENFGELRRKVLEHSQAAADHRATTAH